MRKSEKNISVRKRKKDLLQFTRLVAREVIRQQRRWQNASSGDGRDGPAAPPENGQPPRRWPPESEERAEPASPQRTSYPSQDPAERLNKAAEEAEHSSLLFITTLAIATAHVLGISYIDVLLDRVRPIPFLQARLPIGLFFLVLAVVILAMHFATLLKHSLFARRIASFIRNYQDGENSFCDENLSGYFFLVRRCDDPKSRVLRMAIWLQEKFLFVMAPQFLLVLMLWRSLAYHNESLAWFLRAAIWLDMLLIVYLYMFLSSTLRVRRYIYRGDRDGFMDIGNLRNFFIYVIYLVISVCVAFLLLYKLIGLDSAHYLAGLFFSGLFMCIHGFCYLEFAFLSWLVILIFSVLLIAEDFCALEIFGRSRVNNIISFMKGGGIKSIIFLSNILLNSTLLTIIFLLSIFLNIPTNQKVQISASDLRICLKKEEGFYYHKGIKGSNSKNMQEKIKECLENRRKRIAIKGSKKNLDDKKNGRKAKSSKLFGDNEAVLSDEMKGRLEGFLLSMPSGPCSPCTVKGDGKCHADNARNKNANQSNQKERAIPTRKVCWLTWRLTEQKSGILKFLNRNLQLAAVNLIHDGNDKKDDGWEPFISLRGRDLRLADFSLSDLHRVDFTGTDLEMANFGGAHLASIWMDKNVSKARGCGERKVALYKHVNLYGVNLRRASLSCLEFHNSNFTYADLSGANLEGTTFRKQSNISHANFSGANMKDTVFEDTIAEDININWANMEGAKGIRIITKAKNYIGTNFRSVNFGFGSKFEEKTNFIGAYFVGSSWDSVNLGKHLVFYAVKFPNFKKMPNFKSVDIIEPIGGEEEINEFVKKLYRHSVGHNVNVCVIKDNKFYWYELEKSGVKRKLEKSENQCLKNLEGLDERLQPKNIKYILKEEPFKDIKSDCGINPRSVNYEEFLKLAKCKLEDIANAYESNRRSKDNNGSSNKRNIKRSKK